VHCEHHFETSGYLTFKSAVTAQLLCPCRSVNKAEREKQVKTANSLWGAQAVAAEDKKLKRRASLTAHRETAAFTAPAAATTTGTTHYIDQDVRSGSGSGGRGNSRGRAGRNRANRASRGTASPSSANGRSNGRGNGHIPPPVLLVRPGYVASNGYVYPLVQQQYVHTLAARGHASQQQHMLAQQQLNNNHNNNNYQSETVAPAAPAPAAPASPALLHATARSFVPTLISESSTEGMNPRAPAWIPGGGFKT
jgi:hypothetical protein